MTDLFLSKLLKKVMEPPIKIDSQVEEAVALWNNGARWRLRLVCCGMHDGFAYAKTWDEADQMRESYTSGPGVNPLGYSAHPSASGHKRAAIVEQLLLEKTNDR